MFVRHSFFWWQACTTQGIGKKVVQPSFFLFSFLIPVSLWFQGITWMTTGLLRSLAIFHLFLMCMMCSLFLCTYEYLHGYEYILQMSLCVHACVYGDLKLMLGIFSIDLLSYSLSSPGSLNQTQVIIFACQLAPEICCTEREYKRAAMSSWPLRWCWGSKLWSVCLCGNSFN